MRLHLIYPLPSVRWQILQASIDQASGLAKRSSHYQACCQYLAEEYIILLPSESVCFTQHHGTGRNSFIRGPPLRHGLSYCPRCGKEGQNEGTMVNHLHTIHYCLGLACTLCLAFFTTSADTMRKHGVHCKASHTKNQEEEETSEGGNNDEDDEFLP